MTPKDKPKKKGGWWIPPTGMVLWLLCTWAWLLALGPLPPQGEWDTASQHISDAFGKQLVIPILLGMTTSLVPIVSIAFFRRGKTSRPWLYFLLIPCTGWALFAPASWFGVPWRVVQSVGWEFTFFTVALGLWFSLGCAALIVFCAVVPPVFAWKVARGTASDDWATVHPAWRAGIAISLMAMPQLLIAATLAALTGMSGPDPGARASNGGSLSDAPRAFAWWINASGLAGWPPGANGWNYASAVITWTFTVTIVAGATCLFYALARHRRSFFRDEPAAQAETTPPASTE